MRRVPTYAGRERHRLDVECNCLAANKEIAKLVLSRSLFSVGAVSAYAVLFRHLILLCRTV